MSCPVCQVLQGLRIGLATLLSSQSLRSCALSETSRATADARACISPVLEHCDVAPTEATARKGSFLRALPDKPSHSRQTCLQGYSLSQGEDAGRPRSTYTSNGTQPGPWNSCIDMGIHCGLLG